MCFSLARSTARAAAASAAPPPSLVLMRRAGLRPRAKTPRRADGLRLRTTLPATKPGWDTAILDQIDERADGMAGAVWPDAQAHDYSRIDGGARLTPHCAYGE